MDGNGNDMLGVFAGIVRRGLIALVVVSGFVACGLWWYAHAGRETKPQSVVPMLGYLEVVNGQKVLHLKGEPYVMGRNYGTLLKDELAQVQGMFDGVLAGFAQENGIPAWVAGFVLDCVYRGCAPHIPDRYKLEMEGIADASGIRLATLRRMHVMSELTERHCSVYAAFGKATCDGRTYMGRNFDWAMELGLQEHAILILYEPEGYVPFASAGYVGLTGILSGMNMDGISIGQIGAVTTAGRSDGVPLMFMMRRVLEEARCVNDATTIFTTARRTVGYNYVVADGDHGMARAYETNAHYCAVFADNDPKETVEYAIRMDDAVFRADEAMDQDVRKSQTCAKGYPNMPYGSNSYDHRYKGMASGLKANYGALNAESALQIVRDTAMRDTNLHGVLADVTDRILWVAHAKGTEDASKQPYVRFDLYDLFRPASNRKQN